MGKFWDWHKKMWDKPVAQWLYTDDSQGNTDFRMEILGSKFFKQERVFNKPKELEAEEWIEGIEIKPIKPIKMIEVEEIKWKKNLRKNAKSR